MKQDLNELELELLKYQHILVNIEELINTNQYNEYTI